MRSLVWLSLSLLMTGCATAPREWEKVDGKPVKQEQFELDQTACRGESQKARLSSTMREGVTLGEQGLYSPRQQAISDVYAGCMAGKGYIQKSP